MGSIPLSSIDIAFRVAPRINAAGRMESPDIALRAILEGGEALAQLEELNRRRQDETASALEQAMKSMSLADPAQFVCVADAAYHHGILGLIAGKLTEHFGRPSMACAIHDDECTASLRSPRCYDITAGLTRNADLFVSFGGHAQAAGCTFKTDNLQAVRDAMAEDVLCYTHPDDLALSLTIDASLTTRDLSLTLCRALQSLEPFGNGNPEPVFFLENVQLESIRRVGTDGAHLQAKIGAFKAIGFHLGKLADTITGPIDVACRVGIDRWNGREAPQLFLVDVREFGELRESPPSPEELRRAGRESREKMVMGLIP